MLFVKNNICLFCKENNIDIIGYLCKDCYERLEIVHGELELDFPYIKKTYYSLEYNRFIREIIGDYKFNGKNYLYKPLGQIMVETITRKNIHKDIDIIIYIPIHRRKEAIRGYNQAELLGNFIGKELNIPVSKNNLVKIKWTKEQSHLTKINRATNLKDSFKVKDINKIKNKKILLVDDIITTGATMGECSRLLINSGVKEVITVGITSSKKGVKI
ncbi:ComF family protein [Tissierella pigra]|uniref:ComF family protein n=1 Tax=Tissierella pigra TaxID=2607614 RepID=A0A6N7XRV9_9FIRM|nr:phosphoribosyltransferase family protein [Tissierella pigra]MBU5427817.1 ComF family protein [Tissierella pigra]MSU00143.1 ComF family protein [Tissierella pigra]